MPIMDAVSERATKALATADEARSAVNVDWASCGFGDAPSVPAAGEQRTVLSRACLKGVATADKVSEIAAELATEGRSLGLRHFTPVEVIERPQGNRPGQPTVYLFRVYGS
jgi:hypothetical protein